MSGPRILVCGSRTWRDRPAVEWALDQLRPAPAVIIEGEAPGADRIAYAVARARAWAVAPFPANWDSYGKAAGVVRNLQMLHQGLPDRVLAFTDDLPNSSGTRHMVTTSRRRGFPVTVFSHTSAAWVDVVLPRRFAAA